MMAVCGVCFRHCDIPEGKTGFCGGRIARNGRVEAYNYGRITSLALDPIEKKPLARFFPGSMILSAGSFGCNLRCPFCQNHDISWSEQAFRFAETAETASPEELVDLALKTRDKGNIGIAFTYNEPLIGYEFVRDTARLANEAGLRNVMVTNGTAELSVLKELESYIDAMNIDLKGFTDRYYSRVLGGDRSQVMAFITEAVKSCHVELTTLIVPGENDSETEIRELSEWVSGLKEPDGDDVPLHITRFFPRFHMTDRGATDVKTVYRLADTARERLKYVYTGNC
ncbi:MAG: AmmeMemoRadiSam system radical SAM enzyme [Oscillospiraceae bacterium]|nr:AmmeMemoRadiSam system radical SAM enzyme [Oscillospiraceae bacterium]